jgi:hypothetical protein
MKTRRKSIFLLSLISLLGLTTLAQADYINDCQGVNYQGFHFSWCQAHHYAPPSWRPYGPYYPSYGPYNPDPYWYRPHHHHWYRNCWIEYTPWGAPIRRCNGWR